MESSHSLNDWFAGYLVVTDLDQLLAFLLIQLGITPFVWIGL